MIDLSFWKDGSLSIESYGRRWITGIGDFRLGQKCSKDEVGLTRDLEAVERKVDTHKGLPQSRLIVTTARRVRRHGGC